MHTRPTAVSKRNYSDVRQERHSWWATLATGKQRSLFCIANRVLDTPPHGAAAVVHLLPCALDAVTGCSTQL